jgi:hypothetical protein
VRDELSFDNHLRELTSAILGDYALCNQKDSLKRTPKHDNLSSVKKWINRMKNINSSYLPLMQENDRAFIEKGLIYKVISKNLPSAWVKDFIMYKLHLKTCFRDALSN